MTSTSVRLQGAAQGKARCDVCGERFFVRFAYQMRQHDAEHTCVCSRACLEALLAYDDICSVCDASFNVEHAWQVEVSGSGADADALYCGPDCRAVGVAAANIETSKVVVFAENEFSPVQNHPVLAKPSQSRALR